jgi:hypothetical protein
MTLEEHLNELCDVNVLALQEGTLKSQQPLASATRTLFSIIADNVSQKLL